jgi:hypothetical protein
MLTSRRVNPPLDRAATKNWKRISADLGASGG